MKIITFEDFCREVQEILTEGIKQMPPDGDIMPALYLSDGEGGNAMAGIDPNLVETSFMTDIIVPNMIQEENAIYVALLTHGWMAFRNKESPIPAGIIPPQMDPDRIETILLIQMNKAGDQVTKAWKIFRDGEHPRLEPLKGPNGEDGGQFMAGGQFVQSVRAAWR